MCVWKQLLKSIGLWFFRLAGTNLRDCRTGRPLGRALLLPWRGKIVALGLERPVVPVPLPQRSLKYWKQEIGFTVYEPPRCTPRSEAAAELLKAADIGSAEPAVLLVLLDHRDAKTVAATARRWLEHGFSTESILVLHGGEKSDFDAIDWPQKGFLDSAALRTRDHQREKQSYRAVLDFVTEWIQRTQFTHILFVEQDQIPIAENLPDKFLERMQKEDADVLCHGLTRLDGSTHAHWLFNMETPLAAHPFYCMLGTGHFWKRGAWMALSHDRRFGKMYLEIDLASTAAALGFRLVELTDQEPFVSNLPENLACSPEEAAARGAWTMHPVRR